MKTVSILDKKSKSPCWSIFGLPAKAVGGNKYEIIKKFASCKTCFQTYSYSSSTSTLTNHKSAALTNKNQPTVEKFSVSRATPSFTFNSTKPTAADPKQNKISEKHKDLFISSLGNWVCLNVRPISLVEDIGLKDIIDQCIQIGRAFN